MAIVDTTAGFLTTTANNRYNFRTSDTYTFLTNPSTGATTYAAFVLRVSPGDLISGTYAPLTTSTFTLNDTSPAAPVVTGALVAPGTSVKLTITRVSDADSYNVYRLIGADAAFSSSYTKIATVLQPASGNASYTDVVGLPAGTDVHYFVRSVLALQEGPLPGTGAIGDNVDMTLASSVPVGTAPKAIDTIQTFNVGLAATLGTGDVVKVVFDSVMSTPATGSTIRVQDGDASPTVADLNSTNATFALNAAAATVNGVSRPAGTVMTITLIGDPAVAAGGTTNGVQEPATITDEAGITGDNGIAWNIAGSTDKVIEPVGTDTTTTTAFAPTVASLSPVTGAAAGGTAVTITGSNFTGTTGVTFGGVAATSVVVVSDTSITVVTGAHLAGAVAVVVTNPIGAGTLAAGYTYV